MHPGADIFAAEAKEAQMPRLNTTIVHPCNTLQSPRYEIETAKVHGANRP